MVQHRNGICLRKRRSRWLLSLVAMLMIFTILIGSYISSERDPYENINSEAIEQTLKIMLNTAISDAAISKFLRNSTDVFSIHVMIIFTKAEHNTKLQNKFRTNMKSMFRFLSKQVTIHLIGDDASTAIARQILFEVANEFLHQVKTEDVKIRMSLLGDFIALMQMHFGQLFHDYFYFISTVSHILFPTLDKVIMLDTDLKFNADLMGLYKHFDQFSDANIIGIGPELQPVYRDSFRQYRNLHPDTRIGGSPKDGQPGYNSGVVLLNLEKMRKSQIYNELLTTKIRYLMEKYRLRGHLGDQCFFTLLSTEYNALFYELPCTWNRQLDLCQFWKSNGDWTDYFYQYYNCEGHINIYHGNCDTKIPKLNWE